MGEYQEYTQFTILWNSWVLPTTQQAKDERFHEKFSFEGGTFFGRDVAQPFRFTLGGPLRLSASAIDQYSGTDYFLATPGYLRRIHALPAPINGALYLGGAYEIGQMRAPFTTNLTPQPEPHQTLSMLA